MSQEEGSEVYVDRDQQIWVDYAIRSMTQRQVAKKHNLSQQQVSRIIARKREELPLPTREELIQERVEQLRAIINAVMDGALNGNRSSIKSYVELTERESMLLGLDAPKQVEEKSEQSIRYQIEGLDDEDD